MKRTYEFVIVVAAFLLMILPHLKWLSEVALCGWDCPWYLWHLATEDIAVYHTFTEPLYFWLTKPFVMLGADPVFVMKASMIGMLLFSMAGVYLLAKRLGMNLFESLLAVALFAINPLTWNLWNDTLRNFLAFSFFPYLIYFLLGNKKLDVVLSYLMIVLMALSHRMVLIAFPVVILTRIIKRQWRMLSIELLSVIVPTMIALSLMTDKVSGLNLYGFAIVKLLEGGWLGLWPNHWHLQNILNAATLPVAIFFSLLIGNSVKEKAVKYIFYYIFAGSIFFSKILANRPIMLLGLFLGLMAGLALKRTRETTDLPHWMYLRFWPVMFFKKMNGKFRAFNKILVLATSFTILTLSFGLIAMADNGASEIERKFIDDIELPPGKGTILLVPDRLYWYAQFKHPDISVWRVNYKDYSDRVLGKPYKVVNYPTPDEADVYRGINRLTNLYYLDTCSHFSPILECPLVLKYSEKNSDGPLLTKNGAGHP